MVVWVPIIFLMKGSFGRVVGESANLLKFGLSGFGGVLIR